MKNERNTGRPLPPSYPGTWNVWDSTSSDKLDVPINSRRLRASQRQLLANEIGDYGPVTKDVMQEILTAIDGLAWYDIPLIVHRIVCPQCNGDELADTPTTWHQPALFPD